MNQLQFAVFQILNVKASIIKLYIACTKHMLDLSSINWLTDRSTYTIYI